MFISAMTLILGTQTKWSTLFLSNLIQFDIQDLSKIVNNGDIQQGRQYGTERVYSREYRFKYFNI